MSSSFGTPNSGSRGKRNWITLKSGETGVYRILPPYGSLRESGHWATFYKVQYGYFGTKFQRTFQTCEESTWTKNPIEGGKDIKTITVEDPATTRSEAIKARYEEEKEKVKNGSGDPDMEKKLLEAVKKYNLDKKCHMNVIGLDGKVGVLKISHTQKQQLDAELARLEKGTPSVKAITVEDGRFFEFGKTGYGFSTETTVRVHTKSQNVPGIGLVDVPVTHVATEEHAAKIKENGADLATLYPKLTQAQIKQVVEMDLQGNKAGIDALFESIKTPTSAAPAYNEPEADEPTPEYKAPVAPEYVAPPVAAAPATTAQAIEATAAAAQAAAPQAAAPAASFGTPPAAKKPDVSNLSNADFLKAMGV